MAGARCPWLSAASHSRRATSRGSGQAGVCARSSSSVPNGPAPQRGHVSDGAGPEAIAGWVAAGQSTYTARLAIGSRVRAA
jgi:hypothetical protein